MARAYSIVVVRGIRIAETRVRLSLGPQKITILPTSVKWFGSFCWRRGNDTNVREDIKKLERKLKSEDKKLPKNVKKLNR